MMSDSRAEIARQSWFRRHTAVTVVAVCVAVVASGLLLMHCAMGRLFGTSARSASMATVIRRADVRFPPSAKLLNAIEIEHFIDSELYARVEIDRNDVDAFVAALKGNGEFIFSRKNRLGVSNSLRNWRNAVPVPDWWKPDSSRHYVACLSYLRVLLISLDDARRATIWVHSDTDGPPHHIKKKWFPPPDRSGN